MAIKLTAVLSVFLSTFLVFSIPASTNAQDDSPSSSSGDADSKKRKGRPKPQLRRVQAPGAWAAKRIVAAQEALANENWAEALEILQEMKDRKKLNGIETATMWQFYGFIYSSREPPQYGKAVVAFEKALEANALPEATQMATWMNVAQLYVIQERYNEAIETFDRYFAAAEDPSPDAYYMYAIALLQKGSPRKALPWAEKAVEGSANPKEAWLQLLSSLYFETKQYKKAIGVLEILVARYPKKSYFIQLAALNNEIGKEQRALAVLELAYHQKLLDQDSEFRNLAQLYLSQEIPFQAARVMERGMRAGKIKKDRKAYDLLAQALLLARERERAVGPLNQSASRSSDGAAYLRLAQVHLDTADWAEAEEALEKAIEKGKLKKPGMAKLLLGIAYANQEEWEAARDAFLEARENEKTEKSASQWLQQVAKHVPVDLDEEPDEIELVDGYPAHWKDLPEGDRAVLIGGVEAGIIKLDQKAEAASDDDADGTAPEADSAAKPMQTS